MHSRQAEWNPHGPECIPAMGRQIIISTHNEHFYELLKVKMDADYYPSKFIELGSAGVIK